MKYAMKNSVYFNIFMLFGIMLLTACGGDDEGPSYSFLDQDTQGLINTKSWEVQSGIAQESVVTTGETSIDLTSSNLTNPCDDFSFGTNSVFFSAPNAVGIYELVFDFDDFSKSRTVTLFDASEVLNVIATEGAIEILTITSDEITGRIDARADGESFVNGNFTATVCF